MSDYQYEAECEMWDAIAQQDRASTIEWFNGERIRDTGRRTSLHGADWRVCRYMEGPRAGEECLRPLK